jgi:DNA-binding transcriptional MerR regulator
MTIDKHTMTVGDVARVLGVTADRVRQLDADLKPVRGTAGHRRYDPAMVKKLATLRAA